MSETTYKRDDAKVSNTRRLLVHFSGREYANIKALYKACGEPEPEGGSALGHNSFISDWLRLTVFGEIPTPEVSGTQQPEATSDYWPLVVEVTESQETALMESYNSADSREAYRGNSPASQAFRQAVQEWLEGVVSE